MNPIDLYFRTTSRADFESDLLALGLLREIALPVLQAPSPEGSALNSQPSTLNTVALVPVDSDLALDYIGLLVDAPAVLDTTVFPPVVVTPATFHAGERASLRLTGPLAESRAVALAAAPMSHTQLLAPADVPPSQMRWAGGGEPWNGQASVPPPTPDPAQDLSTQKARLLARLAQRRWEVETGGITVNGAAILTDRESTAMMGEALQLLGLEPAGATIQWKAVTGFVTLDLPTLQAVARAVGQHVQACFAHEATLAQQISAANTAEQLAPLAVQVEAFNL